MPGPYLYHTLPPWGPRPLPNPPKSQPGRSPDEGAVEARRGALGLVASWQRGAAGLTTTNEARQGENADTRPSSETPMKTMVKVTISGWIQFRNTGTLHGDQSYPPLVWPRAKCQGQEENGAPGDPITIGWGLCCAGCSAKVGAEE